MEAVVPLPVAVTTEREDLAILRHRRLPSRKLEERRRRGVPRRGEGRRVRGVDRQRRRQDELDDV